MFGLITTALAEEVDEGIELSETEPTWFSEAFKKLGSLPWWGWVLTGVMMAVGVVLFILMWKKGVKRTWSVRMLSLGAMCMALTVVLSRIRLLAMPNGGSVTPASKLPLMLFAYLYGPIPGMLLGALYGLLDYAFGGYFLSVPQFLLDYPVAFAMLGLAGCFSKVKNETAGFVAGTALGSVGRYIAVVLAGVVFWADGRTGLEAWTYSLAYNGTYMGIECAVCVVLAALIGPRLLKEIKKVA